MVKLNSPIANPAVILREEFDDWSILFNPDTSHSVGVNPLGVAIWKLLDGNHDLPEILVEIQDKYANVPGSAESEISGFIDQLVEQGFAGITV
jgi:SynChlorMet cassette protein ScmD